MCIACICDIDNAELIMNLTCYINHTILRLLLSVPPWCGPAVIDNKWNTVRVISAPCPSSACGSPSSSVLVVQNDGNLVLYASAITVATGFRVDGRILWQSGTAQLS